MIQFLLNLLSRKPDSQSHERLVLQEYSSGIVFDTALAQYSALWERLGTMQQTAGIMMTVLSLIITLQVTLFIAPLPGLDKAEPIFDNSFLLAAILSSILFSVISLVFLYKVITPKTASHLKPPIHLQSLLWEKVRDAYEQNQIFDAARIVGNSTLIREINAAILSIEGILKSNRRNYIKSLRASLTAIIMIAFYGLLLVLNWTHSLPSCSGSYVWSTAFAFDVLILILVTMKETTDDT